MSEGYLAYGPPNHWVYRCRPALHLSASDVAQSYCRRGRAARSARGSDGGRRCWCCRSPGSREATAVRFARSSRSR